MKKIFTLTICVLIFIVSAAQTYAPWEPSQGPLNFTTLDVPNHPYIRLTYNESTSQGINNYENNTVPGPNPHHQLITANGSDPCRCFQINGNNYVHENYLPTPDVIAKPDGSPVDTIIQLGSPSLNNNTQIEYWFYPQEEESVLLVCFSFAEEDVTYHAADVNPRFYIEVLDGETDQLIQSGYYPTEASAGTANPVPNTNWPLSRFLVVPSGNNASQDHSVWSNALGFNIYYWAFPQATPTTFPFRICPYVQNGGFSSYDVKWFEYKPIAFDLSDYAAQGKSVKLRIRTRSCEYFAHWAYGLFYAKMVSGGGIVAATEDNPVFHLSVPNGFMEQTYEWHYGYDSLDASNRLMDIYNTPAGITGNMYDVYIDQDVLLATPGGKLWPYYCCKMLSYTGVPFVFEYYLRTYHLDADFSYIPDGDSVHFEDASTVYYQTPPSSPTTDWDTVYENAYPLRWYVLQNGEFILFAENESNPSYTFTPSTVTDGEATVMLVVRGERCEAYDTVVKSIPISLSDIPDREHETVTIMPNPTNGSVRVSADQNIQNIRILNADGKLLNTVTIQDKAATLDLGSYDGGIFLLDIHFKDSTSTVKKVVKR